MRRLRYLRAGARALSAAVLVGAGLLSPAGCGPIQYLSQVDNKAAGAVLAAKNAGADRYAPYEFTAASEYLKKAREEGAYAQYQAAIAYGRRAEELALQARTIAEAKTSPGASVGVGAGAGAGMGEGSTGPSVVPNPRSPEGGSP